MFPPTFKENHYTTEIPNQEVDRTKYNGFNNNNNDNYNDNDNYNNNNNVQRTTLDVFSLLDRPE